MEQNDPNRNRRYDTWDGVGCGGCAAVVWLGPPLVPMYYDDWGYTNYQDFVVEQNVYIDNGDVGGACGGSFMGGADIGDDGGAADGGGGWFGDAFGGGDGGDGGGGCGGGDGGGGCGGGGCGGD